jgi:hypothetical protein
VRLRDAKVGREVQVLAMQVRQLDGAVVDDPKSAHARAGQVGRDGGAERPGPDHEHARIAERALRRLAPLRQHELSRVTLEPRVRRRKGV